jgi:hypothetical protein
MITFPQLDDHIPSYGFLRLTAGPLPRGDEKDRVWVPAKVMAQNMEGPDGVAKGASDFLRLAAFHKIGTKGLVDTVLGILRFKKEAAAFT